MHKKTSVRVSIECPHYDEKADSERSLERKMRRSWFVPREINEKSSVRLTFTLVKGKDVDGIRVARSSGNSSFDTSAEVAVKNGLFYRGRNEQLPESVRVSANFECDPVFFKPFARK